MKQMIYLILVSLFLSCGESTTPISKKDKLIQEIINSQNDLPTCPKNHGDSIIPIIYGFPSEESFQKADSGLVYLGGCDMAENAPVWYCKIHDLTF